VRSKFDSTQLARDKDYADHQDLCRFFIDLRRVREIPDFFASMKRAYEKDPASNGGFLTDSDLVRTNEVRWCKVLAWLLSPKSGHIALEFQNQWLGSRGRLVIQREQCNDNGESRYDLVLDDHRKKIKIVIEAKVGASEDKGQLRRYREEHGQDARGIFLTLSPGPLGYGELREIGFERKLWSDVATSLRATATLGKSDPSESENPESLWRAIAWDFAFTIERHSKGS